MFMSIYKLNLNSQDTLIQLKSLKTGEKPTTDNF